ncbi:ketoglutarate semialdehyde dehydrogenase [mine drainage metagenome]|uniref:Ketoglutarate semialdehyde dehydrogenase n=1 Tax=mine drainage metagenome TaxID=410659 RepID=T1D3K6_9ZZZZ
MSLATLLVCGGFAASEDGLPGFSAVNPETGIPIPGLFPKSGPRDLEKLIAAGSRVAPALAEQDPEQIARFLEDYAHRIESREVSLAGLAHEETALPVTPRLTQVEIPRTVAQLREGARMARSRNWMEPVIDTTAGIRSCRGPLGRPVVIFGPNNFPFAFNALCGGDFVAALVAQNPVIAKAHPGHPHVSEVLAHFALEAIEETGLPRASIQLCYALPDELGASLVSDPRIGAVTFTGSRERGLSLKTHADRAGIPFYAEMSSINPVFILAGALRERGSRIAQEVLVSSLLGAGQFCTQPGLLVVPDSADGREWITQLARGFQNTPPLTLLGKQVLDGFHAALRTWEEAGAHPPTHGVPGSSSDGFQTQPALYRTDARTFLANRRALESEAFGPASLIVQAVDMADMLAIADHLAGQLTATIVSATDGSDDAQYEPLARRLRHRAGRLLNDKMPTGVVVSPAMNHGGPYPATNHPGQTAIGLPGAVRRLSALHCYDAVRAGRLPPELRDSNPNPALWRSVDGVWTLESIG